MATAPSKMSWTSERAPTPSGGPKRIRSPPHDTTVPCFPVRRSRYDRIDVLGGTPKREGMDDDHVFPRRLEK
jgi:hypothetical protein